MIPTDLLLLQVFCLCDFFPHRHGALAGSGPPGEFRPYPKRRRCLRIAHEFVRNKYAHAHGRDSSPGANLHFDYRRRTGTVTKQMLAMIDPSRKSRGRSATPEQDEPLSLPRIGPRRAPALAGSEPS